MSLPVFYHEATCVMTIGYPESKTRQLKTKDVSEEKLHQRPPIVRHSCIYQHVNASASISPALHLPPTTFTPTPTILRATRSHPYPHSRSTDNPPHPYHQTGLMTHRRTNLSSLRACVSPLPHAEHRFVTPVFWRSCLWVLAKPRTWAGRTGWRRGWGVWGEGVGGMGGMGGWGGGASLPGYTCTHKGSPAQFANSVTIGLKA